MEGTSCCPSVCPNCWSFDSFGKFPGVSRGLFSFLWHLSFQNQTLQDLHTPNWVSEWRNARAQFNFCDSCPWFIRFGVCESVFGNTADSSLWDLYLCVIRWSTWLLFAPQPITTLGLWTPFTATSWMHCQWCNTAVRMGSASSTSPLVRCMERPSAVSSRTTAPSRRILPCTFSRKTKLPASSAPLTSRGGRMLVLSSSSKGSFTVSYSCHSTGELSLFQAM